MLRNNSKNLRAGFTIMEVLLVMFIFVMLAIGIITTYRFFRQGIELTTSAGEIISTLNLAAAKTLASENSTNYGIHLENNSYTLFSGQSFDQNDPDNQDHELPSNVEITEINLNGGGSEIVFARLSASTTNYGTVVLETLDGLASSTISISPSGQAGLAQTITTSDSRIIDSRHTHFDLSWSLQGATTLSLVFDDTPNPDVTENIVMTGYFDAGQTEFDWQGNINVGGETQTLRVHTHSLGLAGTELCIHRDDRDNSKPVEISIDGKDIVSFDINGTPTVGIWGGEMTQQ